MINLTKQALVRLGRTKTKSALFACSIVGALTLPFLTPAQIVRAENPQNGNPYTLAGSWRIEVGAPPGPTFTAYETFTEGGGSVETNNGPGSGPVAAGIGTWVRTAHRTFLATFVRQLFDADHNFTGTLKVRRVITLDSRDAFTGRDNVDLFDPAGNPIAIVIPPATFHGTRIAAEALTR
jgi:hypothetical protein